MDAHAIVLGGHETEVLGGLQAVPVLLDAAVAAGENTAHHLLVIELGKSLTLHAVAEHTAGIALLVVPAHRIDDLQWTHRLVLAHHL